MLQPTYTWDTLGLQPVYEAFSNFLADKHVFLQLALQVAIRQCALAAINACSSSAARRTHTPVSAMRP